jgi:hypothetical protein
VTDLAGATSDAAQQGAVDDRGAADAAADGDDHRRVVVASYAEQPLGDGQGVDVVVDQDRDAELAPQELTHVDVAPAERRGVDGPDSLVRHRTGKADANAQQGYGGIVDRRTEQPGDGVEGFGAGDVVVVLEHRLHDPVEAQADDGDLVGAELRAQRSPALASEAEERPRPAAARRDRGQLVNQAGGQELPGELGNGGRAHRQPTGQVGPGHWPGHSEDGEHAGRRLTGGGLLHHATPTDLIRILIKSEP